MRHPAASITPFQFPLVRGEIEQLQTAECFQIEFFVFVFQKQGFIVAKKSDDKRSVFEFGLLKQERKRAGFGQGFGDWRQQLQTGQQQRQFGSVAIKPSERQLAAAQINHLAVV